MAFLQNKLTGEVYQAKMEHLTALPTKSPGITFIPGNGTLNIPINYQFTLISDTPIRNLDNSKLTNENINKLLELKNEIGVNIPFTASISSEKTSISIIPSSPLDYDTQYTISILNFENHTGVPGITEKSLFRTQLEISAPYVTIEPTDGSVLVPTDSPIEISFSQPIRNLDDSPISTSSIQNIIMLKQDEDNISFFGVINSSNDKITILPTQAFEDNKTYTVTVTNLENDMDLAIDSQNSSFTTGNVSVHSIKSVNKPLFYPNPVKDNLTIDFNQKNESLRYIEVLDLTGNILIKKAIDGKPNKQIYINLSGLKTGILIIKLHYLNKTTVTRIFKQ